MNVRAVEHCSDLYLEIVVYSAPTARSLAPQCRRVGNVVLPGAVPDAVAALLPLAIHWIDLVFEPQYLTS